jgi:serine/threonine protein phosphatase PrpC
MTTGTEAPGRLSEPTVFGQPEGVRTRVAEVGPGVVGLCHACSPRKEAGNEDSVAVAPWGREGALLMVADGCGGHIGGAEASGEAVAALVDASLAREPETDQSAAMIDGVWEANRRVIAMQRGAACTLAVVGIEGRTARPMHVGDSEIVIVGQRGRERFRTIAHSPTGYMLEAGLIDEAEALAHKDRHVVSNVVGMEDMRIDVGPTIELAQRDTILVASDGLFDNLLLDEIKELIRKGPMEDVVEGLLDAAWERMTEPQEGRPSKRDDLSFVVFRLS